MRKLRSPQPLVTFIFRAHPDDGESLLDSGEHLKHRARLGLQADRGYFVALKVSHKQHPALTDSWMRLDAMWPPHSEIKITHALAAGLKLKNGDTLIAEIREIH